MAAEWSKFCALPAEEKLKHTATTCGESGYNGEGREAVGRSDGGGDAEPDPVETLEKGYKNEVQSNLCFFKFPPQFGGAFPRVQTQYRHGDSLRDACLALQTALHSEVLSPCLALASLALGMAKEDLATLWFEKGASADQLRLARYRPRPCTEPQLLYAEHTDYNAMAFLWRSRTNGLEALLGGEWVQVPVLEQDPGALLINMGDLMELWTGGLWRSPRHRVRKVALEPAEKVEELMSIIWFVGPHPDTRLRLVPLPSPLVPRLQEGEQVVTAGEHVLGKIARAATKQQNAII